MQAARKGDEKGWASSAQPIDPKAEPGTARIKTKPEDVDKVLFDIWGTIAQGNVGKHSKGYLAQNFMRLQGDYFVKQDRH